MLLQAVLIVDYEVSNPYASIFEVQKNGKVIYTKTWEYVTGNRNLARGEENDEANNVKDRGKPSVRIFIVYKNIAVQSGNSRRSACNSTLWKSNAESSISSILLFGYSLRPNGDETEILPGNATLNNRNTRNGQRDKVTTMVSLKNERNSGIPACYEDMKHGNSPDANINTSGKDVRYLIDPSTLNRKLKTNYDSGDVSLEIIPRNSGDVDENGEFRSGLINRNIKDVFVNREMELFDKNAINDNESDNICSRKDFRSSRFDYCNANGSMISDINYRNLDRDHKFCRDSRNKNEFRRIPSENVCFSFGNHKEFCLNARQNTISPHDNSNTLPSNVDHEFDRIEFFSDANDMAYEKPGFEFLAIYGMLLKNFAIILEVYGECNIKSNKNIKRNRRTRFQLVVIPSEVFEKAMRECHIETFELTYSYIFPSDCRMLVGVPIYRNGYLHRKDQL